MIRLAVALLLATVIGAAADQPDIAKAWLEQPTARYGHDVLGGNEYAALSALSFENGMSAPLTIELPPDRVFEDIEARLADLNGDGGNEIVVVEASKGGGAELTVWDIRGGALVRIAATPPIGRAFRWLSPAGIADFDGDGRLDIAYVQTPHLAGVLRVWTLRGDRLVEIVEPVAGFSNHRIGQDFITGRVQTCDGRVEMVMPDLSWRTTRRVWLDRGEIVWETLGVDPTRISGAPECSG
ncbi:MAG: VCBS repeat-containing protein [Pseudomonadota bacterium]